MGWLKNAWNAVTKPIAQLFKPILDHDWIWKPFDNPYDKGGGSSPASHVPAPPPPPPQYSIETKYVQFIAREQVFRFSISGLIPKTIHNMYIDGVKVNSASIKPLSGILGDPLKTDQNGKLVFDYYFQTGLPAAQSLFEQAQEQAALVVGNKNVIVASISDDVLPSSPVGVLSWYQTNIVVNVATAN
jgi:hypothetical protein